MNLCVNGGGSGDAEEQAGAASRQESAACHASAADLQSVETKTGNREPEHCGGCDPDLLLRAWLILNQEGDHLRLRVQRRKKNESYPCVKAIVNPVPSIRQVLNLGRLVEPRQSGKQGVADATEGGRHAQDLVHVLVHKLQALVDQVGDLKEGGGDQDGDDAGRFKCRLFCRVRMLCPAP